ncbi:DUF11 domain-containing protein [Shimazuella sp. AN120528]|uniref:DUF11 domain-containing protein n=1 Tax=Shimazuella soli TaxID=1892854 RepID=UPI001F0CF732|nr:DUF11 domain-containing protein [Shimazuella soli]MCH5586105.1 DUF11 domain-containing protein [Shimazuella soli]
MALIRRYAATINGAITFTGNVLGLADLSNPGNFYIGAFLTTDTTKQVSGFPPGTTANWAENKSAAVLRLTSGAEVQYAELIWGGTTDASVSGSLNNPVDFTTPNGTVSLAPDPATAQQNGNFYVRSADVTNLVKAAGDGRYAVGKVPATLGAVGWTLAVAYKDAAMPSRNITFFVNDTFIFNGSPQSIEVTDFGTPATGPVNARLLVTAMQGDTNLVGDQFLFGPTDSTLQPMSGPNNPASNFFATQINDDNGNLDTSGTAGNLNPAIGGSNGVVRYGWDITNVDASTAMINSQNRAVARFTSNSDAYLVSGLAVQIDVDSPKIRMEKTVNLSEAKVRDVVTYTILLVNTKDIEARNTVWADILPAELQFVPGSIRVDRVPQPSSDPATGVSLGTLALNVPVEITFQAKIVNVPPDEIIKNKASLTYEFESAPGLPIAAGDASSTIAETKVVVRPPTPCERNKEIIENSIRQEEQNMKLLQDAELLKVNAANQAFADGTITAAEQTQIIQSASGVSDALRVLQQALDAKRASLIDLCSGCK